MKNLTFNKCIQQGKLRKYLEIPMRLRNSFDSIVALVRVAEIFTISAQWETHCTCPIIQ